MTSFPTNRALLNAKFEGYKLAALSQDENVSRHSLPARLTLALETGRTRRPLSFEEMRSRLSHNHLDITLDGRAVYVDAEFKVIHIVVDEDTLTPAFHVVYQLPEPITSPEVVNDLHREYPSIRHVVRNAWLVADGYGQMYLLEISDNIAKVVATYVLPTAQDELSIREIPFKILYVHSMSEDTVACILSSRHTSPEEISTHPKHTTFDTWLVTLTTNDVSEEVKSLSVLWKGRSEDTPVYVTYEPSRDSYVIFNGSTYAEAVQKPQHDLADVEMVGIPQPEKPAQHKSYDYSWTQTPETVTVAFPLPSEIDKSAINVLFTVQTLTVYVTAEHSSFPIPYFDRKKLWDKVNPSDSFWTWDRDAEHKFGVMSLHIDKQQQGLKWQHVFAAAGTTDSPTNPDEVDVPETLDPSELYMIRENLEKFTSEMMDGKGTGKVPSLADGEVDAGVDDAVGRDVYVTWIGADGKVPPWVPPEDFMPVNLLATPFPGSSESTSVVIKSDIDGLLFRLPPLIITKSPTTWFHSTTYSALAFVLASKRDTRFTFHVGSNAVFAMESGSTFGGGNVYIYRCAKGKELWADQAILKVAGGDAGSLLGAGMFYRKGGTAAIICLCEGELVIIRDAI